MDLKTEKELVRRAKKDPDAFSQLYELNYSKIFGYVLKRVANIDLAKDLTSETFIKAFLNLWKFKWKNIPFSSWLYRIASNEIVDYFRKEKNKTVSLEKILEPASPSNPSLELIEAQDQLQKQVEFLELHKKISKLPLPYQEVIVLRFFDKKKIKEISQILRKKEGTVKSLLHRALGKLRELTD